ncbi:GPI mannosyltransferase 2 [Diaphorina citri]|uniref:GPI mannosyltransferase 2 n=1 Tax=Diaphorina citri TaxID=121845 RepID=A0A1S3DVY8_DIACI|nr:GPI mannosyltransferase 2 [Diaphorina citri]
MTLLDFISHKIQPKKQWSSTFILNLSFQSQLLLILIQWILNNFIPDHTPDGVFQKIQIIEPQSPTDVVIDTILSPFVRWDAVYFLHIAQFGYSYENTIAFFPLFPKLVHCVAFVIYHVTFHSLNTSSCFLLSAILINFICFSLSTLVIYKLALIVSNKNFNFSSIVVVLFILNPSRVFFIAPYSEALFSLTSFLGILSLYDSWNFKGCIFFAFSVATRSNGILNVGFIIHKYMHLFVSCLQIKKKKIPYWSLLWNSICLFFAIGFIIAPFIFYQNTTRSLFCDPQNSNLSISNSHVISHGVKHNYVLPGTSRGSYCSSYEFPYSYVQRHYWNVGFLRYFQFKQIPNFLLAAPILLLIFHAAYEYFIKSKKIKLLANGQVFKINHYNAKHFKCSFLFSYYLHAFFLSLFCFLCIHVQVSTRMLLSSSPLTYFIVAKYVTERHYLAKYCLLYFCSYSILGLLLFTNYYPWT